MLALNVDPGANVASFSEILSYDAPYLLKKLISRRIVRTIEEGESLFLELKKWIVLSRVDKDKKYEMYSLLIDEVWHQFILFTRYYSDFCERSFGEYIHHFPAQQDQKISGFSAQRENFDEFSRRYEEYYEMPLPKIWYDEQNAHTNIRLINNQPGDLSLQKITNRVTLMNSEGNIIITISDLAEQALAFITKTPAFYGRELPGDLQDEEKVGILSALIECGVLQIAP